MLHHLSLHSFQTITLLNSLRLWRRLDKADHFRLPYRLHRQALLSPPCATLTYKPWEATTDDLLQTCGLQSFANQYPNGLAKISRAAWKRAIHRLVDAADTSLLNAAAAKEPLGHTCWYNSVLSDVHIPRDSITRGPTPRIINALRFGASPLAHHVGVGVPNH